MRRGPKFRSRRQRWWRQTGDGAQAESSARGLFVSPPDVLEQRQLLLQLPRGALQQLRFLGLLPGSFQTGVRPSTMPSQRLECSHLPPLHSAQENGGGRPDSGAHLLLVQLHLQLLRLLVHLLQGLPRRAHRRNNCRPRRPALLFLPLPTAAIEAATPPTHEAHGRLRRCAASAAPLPQAAIPAAMAIHRDPAKPSAGAGRSRRAARGQGRRHPRRPEPRSPYGAPG
mmetsp:Transcript_33856/g.97349  ORF Transcript_33856/g.97349 Transcript_33856/m.97349 type:complete len:227 (+) Transcript_33856:1972-2652(+)